MVTSVYSDTVGFGLAVVACPQHEIEEASLAIDMSNSMQDNGGLALVIVLCVLSFMAFPSIHPFLPERLLGMPREFWELEHPPMFQGRQKSKSYNAQPLLGLSSAKL